MASYRTERSELKDIIKQYKADYDYICEQSRQAYMSQAAAGSTIPAPGVIYGNNAKAEFSGKCSIYKQKADAILQRILLDLKREATEAPSTDAVNTITLFNMRKTITADDVQALLDRYGDNAQAYQAIAAIAQGHDIPVQDHPVFVKIEDAEGLKSAIDKTLAYPSEYGEATSAGFVDFLGAHIDTALADEE